MIFDTLGATLLGNMLAGKGVFIYKGTVFLIPYHLLTNKDIIKVNPNLMLFILDTIDLR